MIIGVTCEGNVKCDHCRKKKIDIYKIIEGQHYCSECYENLGGKDFLDAIRELNKTV